VRGNRLGRSGLSRTFGRTALAFVVGGATALGSVASASASPATQQAGVPPARAAAGQSRAVIVVLRDQLAATPADRSHLRERAAAAVRSQDDVLSRLGPGGSDVKHFTTGNAFAVTVNARQERALAADPLVAAVVPDTQVAVAPPGAAQSPGAVAGGAAPRVRRGARPGSPSRSAPAAPPPAIDAGAPAAVSAAACSSDPSRPQLEPEALQTMHARSDDPTARTAAALGVDGSGVKVGYIADGINPANRGFVRPGGGSAIVDYEDFYGDGPNAPTGGGEAFGDASAIAAQGGTTYDIAAFSNPKVVSYPGGHCYIRVVGVAPGSSIIALKAGSELLPNSAILQAIDYAVTTAKVDVLNESFGANVYPDAGARTTIQLFNDGAVKAGVTVTVSTGDAGITGTIGNPSTDPLVISAAASTDFRLYEQTGYALATRFGSGGWADSNVSALSSGGVTTYGRTPDLLAPGEADWALCDSSTYPGLSGSPAPRFFNCTGFNGKPSDIQPFGGTSESAPMAAGVAALVIQAYRKAHGGASPSPALVKQLLTSTTRDLGLPGEEQGSGLIDARAAVEQALSYKASTPTSFGGSPQAVLDTNQLTLTGHPGATVTGTVTATNGGTAPLTLAPSTRRLASLSSQQQTVPISAGSAQSTPYPTSAAPWVYTKATFTVPTGADRLGAAIAWPSGAVPGGTGPVVRMSLFAPDGSFATNTRPQGGAYPANYGFVDVRRPPAGTWTAVLYTPAGSGFTGDVQLETTTQRALLVGVVSAPVITVPAGASRPVTVRLPTPSVGGDTTYVLSIGSSGGHQSAVPVVVRSLIDTTSGAGTFAGSITGGNARGGAPAESFSYAFDVAAGHQDLAVATTLAGDARDLLETVLVDPHGEVPSVNTNARATAAGASLANGLSAQNVVADPVPGRWHLIVLVQNPVTGNELREQFTGTVSFDRIQVQAPGLPRSPLTTLKAGRASTLTVRVTNRGAAPEAVQLDPRTSVLQSLQLAPQLAGSTLDLPLSVDNLSEVPFYLIPPGTKDVSLTSSSTVPAQVELSSPTGGIDVLGDLRSAQGGSTVSTASVHESTGTVGLGLWGAYVQQIGPYTDSGAPAGTSVLSASALTQGFDAAVSSTVGDPFTAAVDPTAGAGSAIVIAPGASTALTLKINPTAAPGSTVSGVLNVVTAPTSTAVFTTTGEVLASLPYAYTVG